jgi:poly-gamma-glutamate synthesis protein (capsule biosynthesis protein)
MVLPSLVAVGDISFGDHPVCASFGVDSMLRARPELDVFENVKGVLRGHDIIFGNLETVLSEAGLKPARLHSMHMRGRPEYIKQLASAGFNVINVANNHMLQHGERAFEETVDLLRSHGILPIGLASSNGTSCQAARLDVGGTEIVFLGYAFEPDKYYRGVPLYAQAEHRAILEDIRRAKAKDNIVVCSFHWGREFISYPSLEQISVARSAIDAGCDLVLGHHPHVLNGFECYKDKCIFYSLGNCVFDQLWNDDCTVSMAVEVRLAPDRVQFERANCVRIRADYRPAVVLDPRFDERLRTLCLQVEHTLRDRGDGYAREARRKEARNRYLSWLYLLRYVHRYDTSILMQVISEALSRRVRTCRPHTAPASEN